MMKKFVSAIMALTIMAGLTIPASAANDNTTNSSKRYYIDLEMATDKEFEESNVSLEFFMNGEGGLLTYWSTYKFDGSIVDEQSLGSAVLYEYHPDGKKDSESMPITYVPIRRVANALGLAIDWNDKTKNAVLDTPKGKIEFPVGATSITAPDGTTYEEQTYRFPNGDPINIVSMRNGRTYVTVRFLSTFLMPDATFKWKGTKRLCIMGTLEGTAVEKPYGINKKYAAFRGDIDLELLPTLMEVAKSVGAEVDYSLLDLESIDKYGATNRLHINADNGVINVSGYRPDAADDAQMKVLEAMLTDLVNDTDKDAIMATLRDYGVKLREGWNEVDGISQEARNWRESAEKEPITFNEVVLTWQPKFYLSSFTIKTK